MNRHQSNPFLAGWEVDEEPRAQVSGIFDQDTSIQNDEEQTQGAAESTTTTTRRHSSSQADVSGNPFGAQRAADRRLYHRNMSSFEAASLQLEHQQQQLEQNGTIDQNQTDLIAKMTADFQSAIETNDKLDSSANGYDQNPFDPFETIMDDDVSLPSPALHQTATSHHHHQEAAETSERHNHDSIDDDDEELVSTPVRNIKSSPQPDPMSDVSKTNNNVPEMIRGQDGQDENTNSIEKASLFASLLASAEPGAQQTNPSDVTDLPVDQINISKDDGEAIPIIKGSPSGKDGNMDRPVSFFDPFETVIDKDALTSLVNDNKPIDDSAQATADNDPSQQPPTEEADDPKQPPAPIAEQPELPKPAQTSAPAAKKPASKPPRRPEEDSSDSSDDDDRIQIVIKAKSTNKAASAAAGPALVPLLPPPPSKSSMKQARERGQVEDMPSPVMSYKTRAAKADSFEDFETDNNNNNNTNDGVTANGGKQVETSSAPSRPATKKEESDYDEDDDEEDDDNKGQFVIPMTHGSDDEGDTYGKCDTPLYDEDTSYVLEEFPAKCEISGWEMMLRYPPKKKLTSNRFWKKIFVRLAQVPVAPDKAAKKQTETGTEAAPPPATCIALQVFDKPEDKKPMQEIPIQATYTVSEISSQQFDQFGKIFTIKLQYIFYKERVGVRQGQLARFIHTGHIGSSTTSGGHGVDPISIGAIKRVGAPIEHSPQISQIIKLGCTSYDSIRQFKNCLEDYLFKMPIHRDRALTTYKTEEVQMACRDETYIELNQVGTIIKQLARVRLFFLSFLNGTPTVEVGINAIERQGREVVGRMDILPVVTEEWIRLEAWELHSTVQKEPFENPDSRIITLVPPDATFFEIMRFRVRPPRNRELPLQISADMSVTRTKVSINCEVMVPGCVSRKHGQIPCENIAIRIHIPECWIYFFREEKHFRMGSKKSVNRRPGKVKGIERFLGGGGLQDLNDESSLIEVTSGQAKYEHHHQAIVWRAARWPKESQSAYVQNTMKIRLPLTAYDKMPDSFYEFVHVEYTMPATTVSHTTLRSISVNPYDDEPPEKYVKYSAKYEYKVKMRQSINFGPKQTGGEPLVESSPIVIMKQPDLHGDLQREEDSDEDDDDDDDDDEAADHNNGKDKREDADRR